MSKIRSFLAILTVLFCTTIAFAVEFKPLQPNERIAFFGDSITNGGFYLYYLQGMIGHTGAKVYNFGLSGDTSFTGIRRFPFLIQRNKPHRVAFIMGMNDVLLGMREADQATGLPAAVERYRKCTEDALVQTYNAGATAILITPPAYDEYRPGCEQRHVRTDTWGLEEASRVDRELAQKWNAPVIELHPVMASIYKRLAGKPKLNSDRIHPDQTMDYIMAVTIARGMGIPDSPGRVTITGKDIHAEFATVNNFTRNGTTIEYDYTPARLPLSQLPQKAEAQKSYDIQTLFNNELLCVKDLPAGRYTVKIGTDVVGSFDAAELAAGINLAGRNTPQQKQADALIPLISDFEKWMANFSFNERFYAQITLYAKTDFYDDAARHAYMDRWLENGLKDTRLRRNFQTVYTRFMEECDGKEALIHSTCEDIQQKIYAGSALKPLHVVITKD